MIDDALALTVDCPLCGAPEYSPCVYVWPKGVRYCGFPEGSDVCSIHGEAQHERLSLVGTPTKVVHNARKHVVFNRKLRERKQEEVETLRTWLLNYGDIFKLDGEA